MELNELNTRQRKIVKLILTKGYNIGLLINEGLTHDEAEEVLQKGHERIIEKQINDTQDDIDA
jgi:hypothetical protein